MSKYFTDLSKYHWHLFQSLVSLCSFRCLMPKMLAANSVMGVLYKSLLYLGYECLWNQCMTEKYKYDHAIELRTYNTFG